VEQVGVTIAAPGSYQQVTTLSQGAQSQSVTRSVWVADAPLRPGSSGVFDGPVGTVLSELALFTFSDSGLPDGSSTPFVATVDWGDGSTGPGLVVPLGGGQYQVRGSHTYAAAGEYAVTVVVQSTAFGAGQAGFNATVVGTAQVLVAAPAAALEAGQLRDELDDGTWLSSGLVEVSASTGALRLAHTLDFDRSPGTEVGGSPALVYHSGTVKPRLMNDNYSSRPH
jgi:hypothetical protein